LDSRFWTSRLATDVEWVTSMAALLGRYIPCFGNEKISSLLLYLLLVCDLMMPLGLPTTCVAVTSPKAASLGFLSSGGHL
jgi:hypothetical protein